MPSNLNFLRNIAYDDFTENSQPVAAPLPAIFSEESSPSQFSQNGSVYHGSFNESGQVKALTDSEKVALLDGRWDSADLFAYGFPLRCKCKF